MPSLNYIKKSLITEQDLELGSGLVPQERNGINYTLDKITYPKVVTEAQRAIVDPTQFPFVFTIFPADPDKAYLCRYSSNAWIKMSAGVEEGSLNFDISNSGLLIENGPALVGGIVPGPSGVTEISLSPELIIDPGNGQLEIDSEVLGAQLIFDLQFNYTDSGMKFANPFTLLGNPTALGSEDGVEITLAPELIIDNGQLAIDTEVLGSNLIFDLQFNYTDSGMKFANPFTLLGNPTALGSEDGVEITLGDGFTFNGNVLDVDYPSFDSTLALKLDKTSVRPNLASPNTEEAASTLAVADALANANKSQNYKGLWNSVTNNPPIISSTGVTGDFYDVGVPSDGVTTIDGIDDWPEGAKIIFNGSIWEKNEAPGVRSVDGRTGPVILNYNTIAQAALAPLPVGAKYSIKGADAVGDGGIDDFIVEAASGTPNGRSRVSHVNGNHGVLQPAGKIRRFDSIAELVADTAIKIGNIVHVAGDLGLTPFKIVPAGTGSNDGVKFINLSGISGQAKSLFINNPVSKWDEDSRVIIPRHKSIQSKINSAEIAVEIPSGFCLGNSIMQGTGSSTVSFSIPQLLAGRLLAYRNIGSKIDWVPANRSCGGSRSSNPLTYVSDNIDNAELSPISGALLGGRDYCLIMTLRNDVPDFEEEPKKPKRSIQGMLSALRNKNIDAIFVTDPPRLNMSTGEIIDTNAGFIKLRKEALGICAAQGATVVDAWKYFYNLKQLGFDIRNYSFDGIHPNDDGYEVITDLIFQALISDSVNPVAPPSIEDTYSVVDYISAYDAVAGSVVATSTITGLVTSSTARKSQTGEATTEAFVLSNGDTISFDCPAPCHGVVLSMLGGVSGSASMTYTSVVVPGSLSAEAAVVRESTSLFSFVPGVTPYGKVGRLTITSTGTTRILGVTFLCERTSNEFQRWLDATESGTWTESNFASGAECNESSTIGDYADIEIYGSCLTFKYERGTDGGKFTYSVDGGATTEVNAYLNAPPLLTTLVIDLGETKWHTVRLAVTEKDAESFGNRVRFGDFRKYLGIGNPSEDYIVMTAGETYDSRINYRTADVVKSVSGSPRAYDGIEGTSISLNGTGSAVLRLSK